MSHWSANLNRIVLKDLDVQARYAEDENERRRIERLRQRWEAAMSEFSGATETRGRKSVPFEEPA